MRTLINIILFCLVMWFIIRFFSVGGDPASLETYEKVLLTMTTDFGHFLELIKVMLANGR